MRILLISQMLPYLPCHDGFRIIPAKLMQDWSSRHEIHLVAAVDAGDRAHLDWARDYCASVRLASGRNSPADADLSPLAETARAVANEVRPDVIQLEGGGIAQIASALPPGLPKVLSAHDSLSLRYRDFAAMPGTAFSRALWFARSLRAQLFERKAFEFLDAVVVTSPVDGQWLARRARLARPPVVIPNGVDPDALTLSPAPIRGRIVFTGSMNWPPNEDAAQFFARDVFPKVRKQFPYAEFWIVGANPSVRVMELAEIDGVTVTGTVPELRSWIQSAEVYVSPVRFGLGVKNKVLEAMALGVPMVATPKSLSGTPLEHGRHVMIAGDAAGLAQSVAALLESKTLRASLAREARIEAERSYLWTSIARRFEALHVELVELRKAL